MVLVATRRDAGKAQALGLTNSKRWGLPMPVAKITYSKANIARRGSTKCRTQQRKQSSWRRRLQG
jgi:hypothetical protein